jgi:hypothetical protein
MKAEQLTGSNRMPGGGGEEWGGRYLSTADWSDVCSCIVIRQRVKQRTGMMYVATGHFSRRYRQLFMYTLTRVEREPSITQTKTVHV